MALRLRTALNPFKDEFIDSTIDSPKSYREIFESLGTDTNIENALIICEDMKIDPKDYDAIPNDNTRIYIRVFPEGTGSRQKDAGKGMGWAGGLAIAGGLVLSILTGWTGIGGAAGALLMGAGVSLLLGGVSLYNIDIATPAIHSKKDRASVEADPMLKGGKNSKKPYGAIPVLFGKHLITPDYAADPFTTVDSTSQDGTDEPQWLTQLFCAGYSSLDIDLDSFKIGDTPLVNLSKSKDIKKILSGDDDYIKMSIQDGIEDSVKYFPKVVKEKQFNTQIKRLTDTGDEFEINYTTPENTTQIGVDIFFPYGLLHYNDDNDPEETEVVVEVSYKKHTDEAGYIWERLKKFTAKSNKTKTLRFSHTSGVISNGGQFDVKIRRLTDDHNSDSKYVDDVFVGSVRCFKSDAPVSLEARRKTCLISLKTKASDFIEGVVDSLNFIASSKVPDYDGEGTGSEHWSVRVTSNPASLVLYVLRGQINGTPVKDDDIDWTAFESFWRFCNNHKYYCNAVLNSDLTISELYSNIARIGRGTVIKRDQKFSVIYDSTKPSPVQLFTQRNTINYSQTILKPDIPDQIDYEFIDESAGYQTNTRSIFNTPSGEKEDMSPKTRQETSVWGITNATQLFKFARYQQAVSNFRDVSHTIECDIEMLMCHLGDLIEYSGDTALRGIAAGRITKLIYNESGLATGLESDATLPFEGKSYAIRCRLSTGALKTIDVTAYGEGNYRTCHFLKPESGLEEGDLFSFGERESVTEQLIITGIAPGDDLTATITAVDYAPEIFKVDDPDYLIPEFEQKLTVGGTIDDGIITNPTEDWSTYTVYNDSKEMPATPIGIGQSGGWHSINTINSKWFSEKHARSIREGSWSAPRQIDIDRDLTAPTVPVLSDITVSEYGNLSFSFGGSSDSQSGVKKYNIYINNILSSSIDFNKNYNQYGFTYETTRKNSEYKIFVTAVDNENNESKPSETKTALSTVTVIPLLPTNLVAAASQHGIDLSWTAPETHDAALLPNRYIAEVSRDGGATYTVFADTSGASALYRFRFTEEQDYPYQNEVDGYLEKDDIEKNYRFRVKSVSIYGNESAYLQQDIIDVNSYLTWKITGLSVDECRATEKLITLAWSVASDFYGLLKFDLYRNGEKVLDGVSTQVYREYLKGYPEKDFFSGITYRLVARTEADEAEVDGIAVDTSGYLTYKVSAPKVSAIADESGWHIEWSGKTEPYYLYPVYDVYINGEKAAEGLALLSLDAPYPEGNPYPTLADVSAAEIKVVARTEADSAESGDAEKSLSGFRGWLPPVPKLYISAASRTVPLSWNEPDIWGFTGCDVQVAKAYKVVGGKYEAITDESELEWYAPALGRNPYESEEAYRTGEAGGYLNVAGTSVAFTVPLYGQADGALPTMYAYRVRGVSIGARGDWSAAYYVECRPTSAYDVTRAWDLNDNGEKVKIDGALGVKQIFVEELSALSANLGVITDGGLVGSRYNYWAVNDTPMTDGSVLPKGSFRVGGSDQYILVEPRLNAEGVATGEYDITFNVGSLQISASGTRIDGQTFEVYDAKGSLMFSVSPEGSRIRVAEGEYTSSHYSAQVPGNILYDAINYMYVWKYKGDVYFTTYTYGGHSSVLYRLNPDYPAKVEAVLELPFITLYGLIGSVGLDGDETVYAAGQDMESYQHYLLEISLETATYRAHPIDDDLDDSIKDEDGNYWHQNVIGVLHGRIWTCLFKSGSSSEGKLAYYDISGGRHVVCETSTSIVRACEYNGDVYFAVAYGLVTGIVRVSMIDDSVAFGGVPAVYNTDNEFSNLGRFFRIKDGAVEMAGALNLITGTNSDGTLNYTDTFSLYRIPLEKIRWSESEENVNFSTAGEAWTSSVPIPQDETGGIWAFNAYCDGIVVTDFRIDGETGAPSNLNVSVLKENDFDAPEYHEMITIRGSLSVERTLEGMTTDIDFSNQYSIYGAMALPYGLCCSVSVAGTPAVLAPMFIMSADFEQSYSSQLVMRTALYEQKVDVTGGNVYAAGIGFNAIYYDKSNGRRRYYLDTGAWLEFNEDGRLIAQGEQGLPGATGSQGPKGDTGETPNISATATVDGNVGEPEVSVKKTGTAEDPVLEFEFKNLKGKTGDAGKDGERGKQGEQGVSIASIEQTEEATEDGGLNVFTVTKSDGTSAGTFTVRNGSTGKKGDPGELSAETAAEADIADANYAVGLSASGAVTKTIWSKVWSWIKDKVEAAALTIASQWIFKGGITVHAPIQHYDGSITTQPVQVEKGTATDGSLCKFAGSNGMTALASGEAYNNPLARFKSKFGKTNNSEELVLLSDNGIFFAVNCQNTSATADGNMKVFQMDTAGNMSFPGEIDITNASASNSATPVKAIGGTMASNDYWRVAAGGLSDAGFVEIATADNGIEPIYIRQYNGKFATLVRTLTLLDGSGNTQIPGALTASGRINANGGIKIPTSAPSTMEDGMIWIS